MRGLATDPCGLFVGAQIGPRLARANAAVHNAAVTWQLRTSIVTHEDLMHRPQFVSPNISHYKLVTVVSG